VEVADRWMNGSEDGELQRHVAQCQECTGVAEQARLVRSAMLDAFPVPALADFTSLQRQADRLNAWRRVRWFLVCIAALAILGSLIFWMRP
jgi:predicted anti-sigma-YlaC factor YlaD